MDTQSRLHLARIVGPFDRIHLRSKEQHARVVEQINAAFRNGELVLSPFDPGAPPWYFDGRVMHTWFVRGRVIVHGLTGTDGSVIKESVVCDA